MRLKGKISLPQLLQATLVLTSAGHLVTVQDDQAAGKARKQADQLNAHLLHKAHSSGEVGYLASPVTGGGMAVSRFQQLFLLARSQGAKQPADWVQVAWKVLSSQGERIAKEGKALDAPAENLAELNRLAGEFAEKKLPVLQALEIT